MGAMAAFAKGVELIIKNLKLWVLLIVISILGYIGSMAAVFAIFGPATFQDPNPDPSKFTAVQWLMFIIFIIFAIAVQTYINSGTVGCVRDIVKTQKFNLKNFISGANKYFGRYLAFIVCLMVVFLVIGIIGIFAAAGVAALAKASSITAIILGVCLGLIGIILLIYVGLFSGYIPVSFIADEIGFGQAIMKSAKLIKFKFGPVLLLAVMYWIIFLLIAVINFIASSGGVPAIGITSQIVLSLLNIYVSLAYVASFMVFYINNNNAVKA